MRLLIHEEFTGIGVQKFIWMIRSPEVSYGRCVYSSMESLMVSGVQKFHNKDALTHPWRLYWYQESRSSIWKMCLLIHEELLFTFIWVSLAFTPCEDVVTYS
jgi:hypothetical protein